MQLTQADMDGFKAEFGVEFSEVRSWIRELAEPDDVWTYEEIHSWGVDVADDGSTSPNLYHLPTVA